MILIPSLDIAAVLPHYVSLVPRGRGTMGYWRDYARQMEKERDNLFNFGPVLHLKWPLTRWSEKMYRPDKWDTHWQWYETSCPCCRRPLNLNRIFEQISISFTTFFLCFALRFTLRFTLRFSMFHSSPLIGGRWGRGLGQT